MQKKQQNVQFDVRECSPVVRKHDPNAAHGADSRCPPPAHIRGDPPLSSLTSTITFAEQNPTYFWNHFWTLFSFFFSNKNNNS